MLAIHVLILHGTAPPGKVRYSFEAGSYHVNLGLSCLSAPEKLMLHTTDNTGEVFAMSIQAVEGFHHKSHQRRLK